MRNNRWRGRCSGALRRNRVRHRARKFRRSRSRKRAISTSSSLSTIGLRTAGRLVHLPPTDRHDPVKALVVGLVGSEFQSELLAHNSGEKPADRVLLPAGQLPDGLDSRTLGALKHGDDSRLLGANAATGNASSGGSLVAASLAGVG